MRRTFLLLALAAAVFAPGAGASQAIIDQQRDRPHARREQQGRGAADLHAHTARSCTCSRGARSTRSRRRATSSRSPSISTTPAATTSTSVAEPDVPARCRRSSTQDQAARPGYLDLAGRQEAHRPPASSPTTTGRPVASTARAASYDGPALAWVVTACTAPDGTYWAVQSWQRLLPDYGLAPTRRRPSGSYTSPTGRATLPTLNDRDRLGLAPVGSPLRHVHATTARRSSASSRRRSAQPLDSFGRNLYVDTFDSVYGSGWKRENSFLTHTNTGAFCYSVNPHGAHPAGNGTQYRATIIGPGVTPDVMWEGAAAGRLRQGCGRRSRTTRSRA